MRYVEHIDESDAVAKLAIESYKKFNRSIRPLPGKLLVRVLPKERQTTSGLWMPEIHNKPVYEAVVLEVYRPYVKRLDKTREDGHTFTVKTTIEPSVKVGDHVLFMHHVGVPTPYDTGTGTYRIVPENEMLATCEYSGMSRPMTESGG